MNKSLWVCGQFIATAQKGTVWCFAGIFSSEQLAINACRTEAYFIAPATLDTELPHETFTWPGCYYPLLVKDKDKHSASS